MTDIRREPFVYDDGGRAAAGFKGTTSDCVTRAIAIATGLPYAQVYDAINAEAQHERPGAKRRTWAPIQRTLWRVQGHAESLPAVTRLALDPNDADW